MGREGDDGKDVLWYWTVVCCVDDKEDKVEEFETFNDAKKWANKYLSKTANAFVAVFENIMRLRFTINNKDTDLKLYERKKKHR